MSGMLPSLVPMAVYPLRNSSNAAHEGGWIVSLLICGFLETPSSSLTTVNAPTPMVLASIVQPLLAQRVFQRSIFV